MEAGKLNKRLELQPPTKVSDGMGGYDITYSTIATVWGSLWPISAREQIQSMKETMTISHQVRIRYKSSVLPSWRVKFRSRYFNVVSITNPEERNEWLDILCGEAV